MENLGTKTQFQIQLSLKQPFQQSTEQSCDQTNGKYFNLKDVKFLKKKLESLLNQTNATNVTMHLLMQAI